MNEKEREEGRAAARVGKPREASPYDQRTRSGKAWTDGWKKGCSEMAVNLAGGTA
jgi:ribosome modulation factor